MCLCSQSDKEKTRFKRRGQKRRKKKGIFSAFLFSQVEKTESKKKKYDRWNSLFSDETEHLSDKQGTKNQCQQQCPTEQIADHTIPVHLPDSLKFLLWTIEPLNVSWQW